MKTQVTLDPGHGIVLTDEMQKAAGMFPGQTLSVSIQPGEIRITRDASTESIKPTIIQKGKLKILRGGPIPEIPIDQAVRMIRDEIR